MLEKIFIPSPRDHKDGHLFDISNLKSDWLEQYASFQGVTKSIAELLNLIYLKSITSQDNLVSTKEIIESTDGKLTRAALQQRLRAAVNVGLFKQVPVKFEIGLAGKTMMHYFVNPTQLISQLGQEALITTTSLNKEKEKKSKSLAQVKKNAQLLKQHGLYTPPELLSDEDQYIISPANWTGILDQALAPSRVKKSYQKSFISISGAQAIIETRSSKNIMTVDDLMTLFALFTLTVQYHEHNQNKFYLDDQALPNKTPLYITDILSLRGKKDSGPARDSMRDSLTRIEFTDFQLHELTGKWLSDNMPDAFKSDRFRFLARTITASDEAPVESKSGEIKIKPNLYILVWEPTFFQDLLDKDYFFLFPPEILKQHTLIFQLYSFFRNRLVRKNTGNYLLSELSAKLSTVNEFSQFAREIVRELKKLPSSKIIQDDVFIVNLWGYHLKIDAIYKKKKISDYQIDVSCDQKEVLKYARAKTERKNAKSLAPTRYNSLFKNELLPKDKLATLAEPINGQFEPIQQIEPKTKLGRRVKLKKHIVEINAEEITITLSKYTSKEAFTRSITALSAMTGQPFSQVEVECQKLVEQLDWLRSNNNVISCETLSDLSDFYFKHSGNKIFIESLISLLAVRPKICLNVYERNWTSDVLNVLNEAYAS